MNLENGKIILPYGNEESRKVSKAIIDELSMFSITDRGRFEGVGAHDDLVMALALANSATHLMGETFVLIEDMDIFGDKQPDVVNNLINPGIMGLW